MVATIVEKWHKFHAARSNRPSRLDVGSYNLSIDAGIW
jgi:hypothetical protein